MPQNSQNPNAPASMPGGFAEDSVVLINPNGEAGSVPHAEVQTALSNGYKRAVRVVHPQRGMGWMPEDELDHPETLKQGITRYDPSKSPEMQPQTAAQSFGSVIRGGVDFGKGLLDSAKKVVGYAKDTWNEADERAGQRGAGGSPLFELPGVVADQTIKSVNDAQDEGARSFWNILHAPSKKDAIKRVPEFLAKGVAEQVPIAGPIYEKSAEKMASLDPRQMGEGLGDALTLKGGEYLQPGMHARAAGRMAVGDPMYATPEAVVKAAENDVRNVHKGIGETLAALKTPAGKSGIRGEQMQKDVGDVASGDIAKIFRDNPEATKSFDSAAEAVGDYNQRRWDEEYQPFIDQYGQQPTHGEAHIRARAEFKPDTDNLDDTTTAQKWIDAERLDEPRTIAQAREKLTRLNQEPSSPVNPSSNLLDRVKASTKAGLRDEIDNALVNDVQEPAVRGVSQRYGALRNFEDQLRVKAQQYRDQPQTLMEKVLPNWIHAYLFAHGMAIPAAGLGLNLGRIKAEFNKPPSVLDRGLSRMSRTTLEPPDAIAPSGNNLPSQIWGTTPPPTGPIRGLLPPGVQPPRNAPEPPQGQGGGFAMPSGFEGKSGPWPAGKDDPQLDWRTGQQFSYPNRENRPSRLLPTQTGGPEKIEGPSTGATRTPAVSGEKQPLGTAALGSKNIGKMDMPASSLQPTPGPSGTIAPYLTGQHEFSIMSAENPGEEHPINNRIRTAAQLSELRRLGYKPQILEGVENGQGGATSIFVPEMSTQDALAFQEHMRSRFGHDPQQSVITKQGLVDVGSKKVTPIDFSRTKFGPEAETQPYHSVAKGGAERLPFAFGINGETPQPVKTPFEGEYRSQQSIQSGQTILGSGRGAIDSKLGRPANMEALRMTKNGGGPPGIHVTPKGKLADPIIGNHPHTGIVKGDKAIATLEESQEFGKAWDAAMKEAKAQGMNNDDAAHLAANAGENAVRAAGYDGYTTRAIPNDVFLFGDHQVFKPGEAPPPPELGPHPNLPTEAPTPNQPTASAKPAATTARRATGASKPGPSRGGPGPAPPTSATAGSGLAQPDLNAKAQELAQAGKTPTQIGAQLMREHIAANADSSQVKVPSRSSEAKAGGASAEAINRVKSEQARGIKRFRVDTRSGKEIPLIGVDAIDAKPGPYDVVIQRSPHGEVVLDRGPKARSYSAKARP